MTRKCFAVKQWIEMTCLGRKSKTVFLQRQCEHIHDCYSLRYTGLPPLGWHGMKKVLGDLVTTHLSFLPQAESLKATAEGEGHFSITPLASELAVHHSYLP